VTKRVTTVEVGVKKTVRVQCLVAGFSYSSGRHVCALARTLGGERSSREGWGVVLSSFPPVQEEIVEAANWPDADALEDVPEVGQRSDLESFACRGEVCASRRCPLLKMARNDKPFQPRGHSILGR
jgi:hypothetical protein